MRNKMIIGNRVRIVAQIMKLLVVCVVRILPSFLLWVIQEMGKVCAVFDEDCWKSTPSKI